MKKIRFISLLLVIAMIGALFLTGCGKKTKTLEQYIASDADLASEIEDIEASSGCDITITGNDLIYTYNYTEADGMSLELAQNAELQQQLDAALEAYASTFSGVCADIEEETGISGIRCIVNYTFGDYVIATKTFDSTGVVN